MFKRPKPQTLPDLRSFRQQYEEYTLVALRQAKARAETLVNSIRDAEAELRDTLDVVTAFEAALESFNEPALSEMQAALQLETPDDYHQS